MIKVDFTIAMASIFHGINQRGKYSDEDSDKELQLQINCYNEDSLEVTLVNQHFNQQRAAKLKNLLALSCCYAAYWVFVTNANDCRALVINAAFLALSIFLLHNLMQLIKSEKLLLCLDFALQLQTERCFARKSSIFIPSAHIHDICINEVIENLDVRYILIVRTRGALFAKRPIIPIFRLKPNIDCLQLVYKHLNKTLNK